MKKTLRTCAKGHQYYKSSDCPVCPICEEEHKPDDGFLSALGTPARRALQNHGITTLKELTKYSEAEILRLHGIGKTSIPKLKNILSAHSLSFKTNL